MWIRPLADADDSCGAKAAALARLIAAGLRVPDGVVLDRSAFRTVVGEERLPGSPASPVSIDTIGHSLAAVEQRIREAPLSPDLERTVREHAVALGRLAVRSSASIEDGERGAGAGVFASVTDVGPGEVWDAIRAVWISALTPLAVAYARRRDARIEIAVILQRFVPGERMTVYTRSVGARSDELWLARGGQLERIPRANAAGCEAAALALAAETAIGASQGADVELVLERPSREDPDDRQEREALQRPSREDPDDRREREALQRPSREDPDDRQEREALEQPSREDPDDRREREALEGTPAARLWIVQARPIVHPAQPRRTAPPPIVLAPLGQDGRRWTWDIAHNPDPLSPAQSGLVERVDRASWSPYALRVCGGYLYTTPRAPLQAPAPPADRAELEARFAAIETRFVLGDPDDVATAVERYLAFLQIWTCELSPLVAVARRVLLDWLALAGHAPERIPALAASLIGPRRVLRDRVLSPAWDVCVPTFAERSAGDGSDVERSRAPAATPDISESRGRGPAGFAGGEGASSLSIDLARAAADAAERDDIWFARAQWMVRRAMLARGAALGLRDHDIFWLPLDDVITLRTLDPDEAHRRASAARAAHARAAQWDMPLVVHGSAAAIEPSPLLRGVGIGPRVVGRVVRFASLHEAAPVGRGDIVVTRAITPALAMIVEGCAALVSETGGLLDHGAALARELGIPCVVGCSGAWTQLCDGMLVSVDGDAGRVGWLGASVLS